MIISVASGKGGTGKTLVATSLALSLKNSTRVQLLDCDVEEPNDHIFLRPKITRNIKVAIPVPFVDESKCTYCGRCADVCAYHAIAVFGDRILTFPQLCHGCGACTYLCPEKAISEESRETGIIGSGYSDSVAFVQGRLNVGEAMAPPVIRKVREHAIKDGVVIIDVPPGTSCPVVEAIKGSDYCILVTEPTQFGLNDLILAIETVRKLAVPHGVIINRAGVGDGRVEEYCQAENIPILLTIPLEAEIARFYSQGISLAEGLPEWQQKFLELFNRVRVFTNERNRGSKR